jgi:hypothetical protein
MPANGSSGNPVNGVLAWNPSAAAGYYDVYLDSVDPPVMQVGFGLSDTFLLYGGLDSSKVYYWSVRAGNSSNIMTGTGSPWSFGTAGSGAVAVHVVVRDRWNLVSNPLVVPDPRKDSLFPSSTSSAFAYEGGYVAKETLLNGVGYWLKFASSTTVTLWGNLLTDDTIAVTTGWNLIGSISAPLAVGSITSIPGGIVTTGFYGYSGAYGTTDSLRPGRGYWVKAGQDGYLILSSSGSRANRIQVLSTNELPPDPPEDMVVSIPERIPVDHALDQNYPNPFNPTTVISFDLPRVDHVSLVVYDLLGREVTTLLDEVVQAGSYRLKFDATGMAGGMYYYRIRSGSFTETRKMLLLR